MPLAPASTKIRGLPFAASLQSPFSAIFPFPHRAFCGMLASMGSKDKGRKEVKKAPKPKPKPEPGNKREIFTPAPPK